MKLNSFWDAAEEVRLIVKFGRDRSSSKSPGVALNRELIEVEVQVVAEQLNK